MKVIINRLKYADGPRVSPLGDHTTRNYEGDQPIDVQLTWTNSEFKLLQ